MATAPSSTRVTRMEGMEGMEETEGTEGTEGTEERRTEYLQNPALRGSTSRMTKVAPRGISFSIFATCGGVRLSCWIPVKFLVPV